MEGLPNDEFYSREAFNRSKTEEEKGKVIENVHAAAIEDVAMVEDIKTKQEAKIKIIEENKQEIEKLRKEISALEKMISALENDTSKVIIDINHDNFEINDIQRGPVLFSEKSFAIDSVKVNPVKVFSNREWDRKSGLLGVHIDDTFLSHTDIKDTEVESRPVDVIKFELSRDSKTSKDMLEDLQRRGFTKGFTVDQIAAILSSRLGMGWYREVFLGKGEDREKMIVGDYYDSMQDSDRSGVNVFLAEDKNGNNFIVYLKFSNQNLPIAWYITADINNICSDNPRDYYYFVPAQSEKLD